MWTLQFAGEQMQTIATRDAREFVQSPVRPLVDRSVLYKYLNPALLLVATSCVPVPPTYSAIKLGNRTLACEITPCACSSVI
jgi:hypothetical protein